MILEIFEEEILFYCCEITEFHNNISGKLIIYTENGLVITVDLKSYLIETEKTKEYLRRNSGDYPSHKNKVKFWINHKGVEPMEWCEGPIEDATVWTKLLIVDSGDLLFELENRKE